MKELLGHYISVYKEIEDGEDACVGCTACRVQELCELPTVLCVRWVEEEIFGKVLSECEFFEVFSIDFGGWFAELARRVRLRLIGQAIAEMSMLDSRSSFTEEKRREVIL